MTENIQYLAPVRDIADQAGRAILDVYHGNIEVEHKEDDSPLTAADLAAHDVIQKGLSELSPDIPQLSEEGSDIAFETRQQWSRYWLIDPLDGTKEFINRNGQFTVNIALIEDGIPVLGVVLAPDLETSWYAAESIGAYKSTHEGDQKLATVTANTNCPRVLTSKSHRGEDVDALLARMPDFEPISMGSSLKFCVIAEGEADFYPRLGPTSEWDTGAGHAILRIAGGDVIDTDGSHLRYNQKESILNPYFLAYGDTSHDWAQYLND